MQLSEAYFRHLLWVFVLNGHLGQLSTVSGHPKNFPQKKRVPDMQRRLSNTVWQLHSLVVGSSARFSLESSDLQNKVHLHFFFCLLV